MSETHYATLKDGTPVQGVYDTDGTPAVVSVIWQGLQIHTDGEGYINLPTDDGDLTLPQWGAMRELVSAGVVDELVLLAQRFMCSPLGPVEPPHAFADMPELLADWATWPRERQVKLRPIIIQLTQFVDVLSPERGWQFLQTLRAVAKGVDRATCAQQIDALVQEEKAELLATIEAKRAA